MFLCNSLKLKDKVTLDVIFLLVVIVLKYPYLCIQIKIQSPTQSRKKHSFVFICFAYFATF